MIKVGRQGKLLGIGLQKFLNNNDIKRPYLNQVNTTSNSTTIH